MRADGTQGEAAHSPLITILLCSYRGGGAERAMILFAEEAVRAGYRVHLVTLTDDGPLHEIVSPEIECFTLNASRARTAIRPLSGYLRAHRPAAVYSTVVHVNLLSIIANRLARSGARIVIRESNSPRSEKKRAFSRRLSHLLVPILYPMADEVIAVSAGVASELESLTSRLAGRVSIAATPAVGDTMMRQSLAGERHPWFEDPAVPVILGVGRLVEQKNFPLLIRAFAAVRRVRPCRLVILGEGRERGNLERFAVECGVGDDVALPGFSLNPFPSLRGASVMALSSDYEGMPNVLIQALALGTPVVATDCPSGPRECLEDGRLGALVPMGDADALARAIETALDGGRRDDHAAEIVERYSAAGCARRYLEIGFRPAAGAPIGAPVAKPELKVVHCITGLEADGAQRMLLRLAAEMKGLGIRSVVVSLRSRLGLADAFEREGIELRFLDMRRGIPDPRGILRLARTIRRERPDVIMGWMYHANLLLFAARAFFGRRIPVWWNVRRSLDDLAERQWLTRMTVRATARLSHAAEGIIYPTPVAAAAHRRVGFSAEREMIIPNGFKADRFVPAIERRAELCGALGLDPTHLIIGNVGRFDVAKGHDLMFEALSLVSKSFPNARLVCAGRGVDPENGALIESARRFGVAEACHFLGEHRAVHELYPAFDLFLLGSRNEGFPNVLAEAMLCEIPCVATDTGASADIVGSLWPIVPLNDPRALAEAVLQVVRLPAAERAERARRGRRRIIDRYSLAAVAGRYRDILISAADGERRGAARTDSADNHLPTGAELSERYS